MDETIHVNSQLGKRLSKIKKTDTRAIVFQGQKIPLVSKITLGRDRKNNIVVDDKMVSRIHCLIQKIKEDYFIKDLDSSNGTFVNTMKVPANKYVKLQKGDIICLGKTELTIL